MPGLTPESNKTETVLPCPAALLSLPPYFDTDLKLATLGRPQSNLISRFKEWNILETQFYSLFRHKKCAGRWRPGSQLYLFAPKNSALRSPNKEAIENCAWNKLRAAK